MGFVTREPRCITNYRIKDMEKFDQFISKNCDVVDIRDSMQYNALYRAYLCGYSDATSDSVEQLKLRMKEFGGISDDDDKG